MHFQPGNSGREKGVPLLATIQRDVRKSAIRTIGPRAPELLELCVARALAGNELALAACMNLLSAMAGEKPARQPPSTSPAAVTNSPDRSDD
jgi:hypothetical protein